MAFVAKACAPSATRLTPATPAVVVTMNESEPKWCFLMPAISAEPSRSSRSPTMNSCPTNWASVIEANTCSAQETLVELGVGVGDELEVGADVDWPPTDELHPERKTVMATAAAGRARYKRFIGWRQQVEWKRPPTGMPWSARSL